MKFQYILALCLLLITVTASSQVKFSVKAGTTFANYGYTPSGDENYASSSRTSFYAGSTVEIKLGNKLAFEPGILLTGKGHREYHNATFKRIYDGPGPYPFDPTDPIESVMVLDVKNSVSPWYIDVPMNFKYSFNVKGGKLGFAFGPYIAFGAFGKFKSRVTVYEDVDEAESNIKFGSDDKSDLRRSDFGFNGQLSYEFIKNIGIEAGYGFSLTEVGTRMFGTTGGATEVRLKNRVFSTGLYYRF